MSCAFEETLRIDLSYKLVQSRNGQTIDMSFLSGYSCYM